MNPLARFLPGRCQALRRRLAEDGVDALWLSHLPNIRYLTLFSGSAATAIFDGRAIYLCLDPRYWKQARSETSGVEIIESRSTLQQTTLEFLEKSGYRNVAFEAQHTNYKSYSDVQSHLSGRLELKPCQGLVEGLRRVKDDAEIEIIEQALARTTAAFDQTLPALRAGMTELEAAAELEYRLRRAGGERLAFDTIVASGPRGALPHGLASGRHINKGDAVVFDCGVTREGYCSDFTRVVSFGEPSGDVLRVYGAVRDALEAVAAQLRPGMFTDEADSVGRAVIERSGHGPHFGHGVGHGLGLEIHEEPYLNLRQHTALQPGMVFTLEPGIYVPDRFGVRIEDVACMTASGCRLLTQYSRDLIVLDS